MKATINEPNIEYDVEFWDGKPFDANAKEGNIHVTPTQDVDGRPRGLIYNAEPPQTLFQGDAVIESSIDGKLVQVTAMEREEAIATFGITVTPVEEPKAEVVETARTLPPPPPPRGKRVLAADSEDK